MPTLWLLVGLVIQVPGSSIVGWFNANEAYPTEIACKKAAETIIPSASVNYQAGIIWNCIDVSDIKGLTGYERET